MNPRLLPMRDQRQIDAEHLKLLAIFHFVLAGLAVLGVGFLAVHFTIMQAVFSNPELFHGQKTGPMPAEIFGAFRWLYAFGAVVFICFGILNIISGLSINARKRRTLSLVVAGADCLQFPIGTALGVFTIVVLMRDSVIQAYDEQGSTPESR